MSRRSGRRFENLAGHVLHQEQLERHERQNHLPSIGIKRGGPNLVEETEDTLVHCVRAYGNYGSTIILACQDKRNAENLGKQNQKEGTKLSVGKKAARAPRLLLVTFRHGRTVLLDVKVLDKLPTALIRCPKDAHSVPTAKNM